MTTITAQPTWGCMSGVQEGTDIDATTKQKIAIVGEPGVGKTTLAATAPGPVFIFDFDGRCNAVAGKHGVFVKSYTDIVQYDAKAWLEYEKDLSFFESEKKAGKQIPNTFVPDSVQYMSIAAMNYVLMTNPGMRRDIKAGNVTSYAPKGFDAYNLEYNMVLSAISRLMALGNVIANFHEAAEEAPDSTTETPKYTGRSTVYPVRMKKLLPLFDEKWRLTVANNVRELRTDAADYKWTGGTALKIPGVIKNPVIKEILEVHRKAVKK